jgi:hypothetical protein
MRTTTSLHASAVRPDQLNGIVADCLALERAGIRRQRLARCFGALAAIVAVAGFSSLSAFAFCFSLGLCAAVPVWAWTVELEHERRLAGRLDTVPKQAVQECAPPDRSRPIESRGKKVIKKS